MSRVRGSFLIGVVASAALLAACTPPPAGSPNAKRVSVAVDGTEANGASDRSAVSGDGRYITYDSEASNLVAGDANDSADVFFHDRQTGTTERVSVASDGTEADAPSWAPTVSADGRYIAFYSYASNLVPNDTNGRADIFLRDRETSITTRASVTPDGNDSNSLSWNPAISADGHFVAFYSYASNLVPDDTNGRSDVFVWERETGSIERASVATDGTQSDDDTGDRTADETSPPGISADGRFVSYESLASNLVPGGINNSWDVYLHDRGTSSTTRVSVASDGTGANGRSGSPSVSADGRFVTYTSIATNLAPSDTRGGQNVFVYDSATSSTAQVSLAWDGATSPNGSSWGQKISADGRYITYNSTATSLIWGDEIPAGAVQNIFVSDRWTGITTRVSRLPTPANGSGYASRPSISANGLVVTYTYYANPLSTNERGGNVLVHDRLG